jgi:ABC-type dipeptide/oligopeptide/nickel transport system permease component
MLRFILKRVGLLVPILLGATVLVFGVQELIPGDVTATLLGQAATPERQAALRHDLGLDQSIVVQYVKWLGHTVQLDLGDSITQNQPVAKLAWTAFTNTVLLAFVAGVLSSLFGLLLGVAAAVRQFGRTDRTAMGVAAVLTSIPSYWLAGMLVAVFAVQLGWFPTGGKETIGTGGGFLDIAHHLVLPAIAAAAVPAGIIARSVRASVLEVLRLDFVQALRARGLSERTIIFRHVLKNALPPILSVIGLQVGYLLGGVVFVEIVFSWPGIGQLLFTSISARDYPVIVGAVVITTVAFALLNLLVDVLYTVVDPRTRSRAA